jgi:hypothetical protein
MIPLETAPPVDHDNYLASGNTNGSEYDEEEETPETIGLTFNERTRGRVVVFSIDE